MTYRKEFSYFKKGRMMIGWRHRYMTKGARERYFAKLGYKTQKGRKLL